MEEIRNLLNQVAIICKKNAEILDATGGRFNMFRMCGVNHYENTHSAIIAEFLNPNGTHGLKSKLLECFIETLGKYFKISNFNCEKSQIRTEYSTEEGRIDILIEDNQKKAIIIENKIDASDQWEQLKRYNKYAEKTYKGNYQILYLTLWGEDASKQSGEGVPYLPISYEEHIIDWLEKCVAITSRVPIVRETIIQYIGHLKQLTNQDMDAKKNKDEITEVLSKFDNLRAAQVIYQNYPATFDYIIQKHFNPKMEEFAKQKGLEYHYERCGEFYVKFHFINPSWQGKCHIGFDTDSSRCHYGLWHDSNNYRISDENKEVIRKHLSDLNVTYTEAGDWPFYAYFTNLSLDFWENDIISDKFLKECKEKTEILLKAMEGVEL